MKPNLVPLSANRICLVCAHAKPRSEFVGELGRTPKVSRPLKAGRLE